MKKNLLFTSVTFIFLIVTIFETYAQLLQTSNSGLPNIGRGVMAVADFNNDNKLDILVVGQTGDRYSTTTGVVQIFAGKGDSTFVDSTATWFPVGGFPGVGGAIVGVGDYNNDGYVDFCYAGRNNTTNIIKLIKNNGGRSFTEVTTEAFPGGAPTGVYTGSIEWGDVNGDGLLDLFVNGRNHNSLTYPTGSSSRGSSTQLFINKGNGTFESRTIPNTGTCYGEAKFADLDNDGDLDIYYSGGGNNGGFLKNDGGGNFSAIGTYGTATTRGTSFVYGDFNKDGKPDILKSYINTSGTPAPALRLYTNTNTSAAWSNFTFISPVGSIGFGNTRDSTNMGIISAADYDNDGDLDYVIQGLSSTSSVVKSTIYLNDGAVSPTFSVSTEALTSLHYGSIIWADFNNDGRPDLLTNGYTDVTATIPATVLYMNHVPATNSGPPAPADLAEVRWAKNMKFTWTVPADDHSAKLTYRLRVGKTPGGNEVVTASHTPALGLINDTTTGGRTTMSFNVLGFKDGTYYWSVQAIDDNKIAGSWATERQFTVVLPPPVTPTVQPSNIIATGITPTGVGTASETVTCTPGNGESRVIFITSASNTNPLALKDSVTYTPNTVYGSGSGVNGWYCVYNGLLNSVTFSNLVARAPYKMKICEYNSNVPGDERYYNPDTASVYFTSKDYIAPAITTIGTPTIYATDVSFAIGNSLYANINTVVFLKESSTLGDTLQLNAGLKNDSTIRGDLNFGLGQQILYNGTPSGWFCVYNGLANYKGSGAYYPFANFTNLKPNTSYVAKVYAYNGIAGLEKYNRAAATNNPFTFTTTALAAPASPDTMINIDLVKSTVTSLHITSISKQGNGLKRALFISEDTTAALTLTDNTTYTANDTLGKGAQVGSWYCVYNGYGSGNINYKVNGLVAKKGYRLIAYNYNGMPGSELYNTTSVGTTNPVNVKTPDYTAPATQSSGLAFTEVAGTQFRVSWLKGNGEKRLVFMCQAENDTLPAIGKDTTYTADAVFGSGSQIRSTGWYCVYNGTDTTVLVDGLTVGINYRVMVCEYNGTPGLEKYLTIKSTANPGSQVPGKAPQSITFAELPAQTFGDADFDLVATASSGLPVTFTSSNLNVATITNGKVHIVGGGTTTITASQAGDEDTSPASDIARTLTVNKAAQTVTFATLSAKTYGDADFSGGATASSGLAITYTSTYDSIASIVGGLIHIKGAGTTEITATQDGGSNYVSVSEKQTFTIAKAQLEVTARDTSRAQGAANPVFTFNYKGFVGNDGPDVLDTKMSATCTATPTSAVGTYKIFPVAVVDNNYEITVVSGWLTVSPKTAVGNLLAENVKVYPNPTADKFIVSMPGLSPKITIAVYSFSGKLVMTVTPVNNKPEININSLAPGVYIVKVITPEGILVKQIVKQ